MDGVADFSFGSVFDELREEMFRRPEERDEYERTVRRAMAVRRMLMAIDAERERRGMSKKDLARLLGMNPAAIRRLFTNEGSNPALGTVLEILAALCIEVEFKPSSTAPRRAEHEGSASTGGGKPSAGAGYKRARRKAAA